MGYKDTNKYFLTGFTLIGTFALFIVTLSMAIGLQVLLYIYDVSIVILLLATLTTAVITSFWYRNAKKYLLDSDEYSRVVVNYIRTTITISLLVIALFCSFGYISMLLIGSLEGFFLPFSIVLLLILTVYIEGLSLLTLFISCCSLRDIDRYNEPILYGMMIIVLSVIGYGLYQYFRAIGLSIIPMYFGVAAVLVTIYMVNGLKSMLKGNEVETVIERYKFATQALTYTIIAPVNIPVQVVLYIVKIFKK